MSRHNLLLLGLAAVFVVLQVASGFVEPYGLFHDEYYYWACARRPGLGYVDHPPFSAWVLALSLPILGDSRIGFGLVPALAGGATVVLTGVMARRLGAGAFGQCLAALCVVTAPFFLGFFSFYSVNAFELLFWTSGGFLLLGLIRTGDERTWLALGLLVGIALLNKHTFALLLGAIGLAVLASPLRAQLRSRYLWLGAAIALLVASPNLVWNALHDWPSLSFYRSVGAQKNLPTSFGEALLLQVVGTNPAAALVWIPGLACLLFSRRLRAYRPLGLAFAVLLAIMLFSGQRRGDRIVGAYPLVFAAGAACWDRWTREWARVMRWALPSLLLALGVALLPVSLPLFSPETVADFFEAIGEKPELEAGDVGHAIPLHLMGRLEWERLAEEVIAATRTLPPEARERAVLLAPHWVLASLLDYFTRDLDLPPVVSPHNAYWFWRGEGSGRDVVISVDVSRAVLEKHFGYTRRIALFECEICANWRGDMEIAVSRDPIRPVERLLDEWRYFGSAAAPALRE